MVNNLEQQWKCVLSLVGREFVYKTHRGAGDVIRRGRVIRVWYDMGFVAEVVYEDGSTHEWWNDYILNPDNFYETVDWL